MSLVVMHGSTHNLQDLGSYVGQKWLQAGQVNDRQNICQSWPNKIQKKTNVCNSSTFTFLFLSLSVSLSGTHTTCSHIHKHTNTQANLFSLCVFHHLGLPEQLQFHVCCSQSTPLSHISGKSLHGAACFLGAGY